jgi:hypothetical protein
MQLKIINSSGQIISYSEHINNELILSTAAFVCGYLSIANYLGRKDGVFAIDKRMIATLKNFGLLLGYYLFQGLIFTILFYKASWFNSHSLLNWDAQHYYKITTEGYDYTRTAFFPLFPLIWKYSGLGLLAISVFNGLLFLGSFAWLSSLYKIQLEALVNHCFSAFIHFLFCTLHRKCVFCRLSIAAHRL